MTRKLQTRPRRSVQKILDQVKIDAEKIKHHVENPTFKDYVRDPGALFNATGTHEVRTRDLTGYAKLNLGFCESCEATTLHHRGSFASGCVMSHGPSSRVRCDSCHRYVPQIVRVVVYDEFKYDCFCELCASPESREKEIMLKALRELAIEEARKPLDSSDPDSFARALGASSYR